MDLKLDFFLSASTLARLNLFRKDINKFRFNINTTSASRYQKHLSKYTSQRTVTIGGSITVRLVSKFTSLDSTGSQHKKLIFFVSQV